MMSSPISYTPSDRARKLLEQYMADARVPASVILDEALRRCGPILRDPMTNDGPAEAAD